MHFHARNYPDNYSLPRPLREKFLSDELIETCLAVFYLNAISIQSPEKLAANDLEEMADVWKRKSRKISSHFRT